MGEDNKVDFLSCRIASIVTLLLSVIINLIVIAITALKIREGLRGKMFFVSLCLIDMLYAIIVMSSMIKVSSSTTYEEHVSSLQTTAIIHSILLTASFTQESHLWMIAYERFYAAKHPLRYREVFTKRRKYRMLIAIWLLPLLLGTTVVFISYMTRYRRLVPISLASALVVTAAAMAYMYFKIFQFRRRVQNQVTSGPAGSNRKKENEKRLVKISLKILLTYIILNLPITIFLFLADIQHTPCNTALNVGTNVSVAVAALNLGCDPMIYLSHLRWRRLNQKASCSGNRLEAATN
ncbi:olfactory receptor 10A6-like [Rhopilema esculentum]|uniref:olfactory receptor 10A6-like n=1 Tax=Rhopilema esculentum TaxID=499914 RepID=UPI0031CED9DD